MKRDFKGWLVVSKELGISSARVVSEIKKILLLSKNTKIGHAGTLDPFACGVLPIAIGEATKTVGYIVDAAKEYIFNIKFGETRDTDDIEGKVIATNSKMPEKEEIISVLNKFEGVIKQVPSSFSAIKVNGTRAYKLARQGEDFSIDPREVTISSIRLLDIFNEKREASFIVNCSKGTYIRSLARDICLALNCCGYVSYLERTRVGKFSKKDAISLDKLKQMVHNANENLKLISVNVVLDDIPAINVTSEVAKRIRHGQFVCVSDELNDEETLRIVSENELVALGRTIKGYFKPMRVFN
jgi:tRNA pseudouridine55 synthase